MSPPWHSVISIYVFNQSYIAFLIGCWLSHMRRCRRAARWESSYFTQRGAPCCQTTLAVLIPLNINRLIISANFFHRSLHLSLKDIVQLWQGALRMFFAIHQMLNKCSDLSAHSCQIGPAWGSLLLKVSHRWGTIFYPFTNTHTFAPNAAHKCLCSRWKRHINTQKNNTHVLYDGMSKTSIFPVMACCSHVVRHYGPICAQDGNSKKWQTLFLIAH